MRTATLLIAAAATALIAAGCGVPDGVKDGASGIADGALAFAKEAGGAMDRSGAREIILDLNPDATSLPRIMSMVEPVIVEAANSGAFIEIWVVTGGVAAAMAPVDLEAVRGGDLMPVGKNRQAWGQEAQENAEKVVTATEIALTQYVRDGTGADLFGAVAIAARRALELPGSGTPAVILISNGIHRTSDLDLHIIDFTTTDPASLVSSLKPIDAPDVAVSIIGAGRFPKVTPPPDPVWANGIRHAWEAFCAASNTESCTVRDRTTEEG